MHRRMNFPLGAREAKRDVLSGAAKVDQPYDPEIFVLKNASNLPEVDLDAKKK